MTDTTHHKNGVYQLIYGHVHNFLLNMRTYRHVYILLVAKEAIARCGSNKGNKMALRLMAHREKMT